MTNPKPNTGDVELLNRLVEFLTSYGIDEPDYNPYEAAEELMALIAVREAEIQPKGHWLDYDDGIGELRRVVCNCGHKSRSDQAHKEHIAWFVAQLTQERRKDGDE